MSTGGEERRWRSQRSRPAVTRPWREVASLRAPGVDGEEAGVLSPRQLRVVDALRAGAVLSVFEIADAVGISHREAAITVAELVRVGVVDRRMGPDDRRRRQVWLTAAWASGARER